MLVHLLARSEVAEAFLLSTCNRTEVYLQPRDEEAAYRAALELVFLKRAPELERPGRLYVKRNGEAARHLLAVASGLESMVLGEPEILGQIKQSAALAEAMGAEGPVLKRLLRSATSAGTAGAPGDGDLGRRGLAGLRHRGAGAEHLQRPRGVPGAAHRRRRDRPLGGPAAGRARRARAARGEPQHRAGAAVPGGVPERRDPLLRRSHRGACARRTW